ncbi:hypothetical protein OAK19_06590, partial [Aureispira]|nr:hypothetical protein [Aureispira sp.]
MRRVSGAIRAAEKGEEVEALDIDMEEDQWASLLDAVDYIDDELATAAEADESADQDALDELDAEALEAVEDADIDAEDNAPPPEAAYDEEKIAARRKRIRQSRRQRKFAPVDESVASWELGDDYGLQLDRLDATEDIRGMEAGMMPGTGPGVDMAVDALQKRSEAPMDLGLQNYDVADSDFDDYNAWLNDGADGPSPSDIVGFAPSPDYGAPEEIVEQTTRVEEDPSGGLNSRMLGASIVGGTGLAAGIAQPFVDQYMQRDWENMLRASADGDTVARKEGALAAGRAMQGMMGASLGRRDISPALAMRNAQSASRNILQDIYGRQLVASAQERRIAEQQLAKIRSDRWQKALGTLTQVGADVGAFLGKEGAKQSAGPVTAGMKSSGGGGGDATGQ